MTLRVFAACLFLTIFAFAGFAQDDPEETAEALRQRLQSEQERAEQIERQRVKLERDVNFRQRRIDNVKDAMRIYEYNIEQSQRIIDGARREIESIERRQREREALWTGCVRTLGGRIAQSVSESDIQRMRNRLAIEAAHQIAVELFKGQKAEDPRLHELKTLVNEKENYQERIRTVYMPADEKKIEKEQALIASRAEQLDSAQAASSEIASSIQTLKNTIQAVQEKIQRVQEERRRQLAARPTPTPSPSPAPSNGRTLSATRSNERYERFADRKGRLSWPAPGKLLRPFGEYLHPKFNVSITNTGIDVETAAGVSVRAVAEGEVIYVGEIAGMGRTVIIDHGDEYLGIYGKLRPQVQLNQVLNSGQVVGTADGSGGESGKVYHFELRLGDAPLNPIAWLKRPDGL